MSPVRGFAILITLAVAVVPASAQALRPGEVKSRHIGRGQVKNVDVAANAISTSKIRKNAVRSAQLQDNGVKGVDVDEASLDPKVLQRRVSGSCALGSAIGAIALDGTVTCNPFGPIASPGSVTTQVLADSAVSGTKIADGTIGAADVDSAQIQRRVTPDCTVGTVIQAIAADGTPTCVPLPSVPAGPAGGALAGIYPNPTLAEPLTLTQTAEAPRLTITSATTGNVPDPVAEANLRVDRTNTSSVGPAIYGSTNSIFGNLGTAGVWGESKGTGGVAGLFRAVNASGNGTALVALNAGNGNALTVNVDKGGNGVETSIDGDGNALYAWVPPSATGRAGRLVNFNTSNANPALTVEQHSNGSIAVFKAGDPSTANVARINSAGRGFFNGGTQTSGADVAEVVPACGAAVEPGDVVEIDPDTPDCFRLARTASSPLVAGVVSTKPGVMLNAGVDEDHPGPSLALAGRVPVKVTGPIRIGDLLVASSTAGHAKRAPAEPRVGTVIGKALERSGGGTAVITALVMSR